MIRKRVGAGWSQDGDGPVQPVVFHRVGHEVEEDLLQSLTVGEDVFVPAGVAIGREFDGTLFREGSDEVDGFFDDVADQN